MRLDPGTLCSVVWEYDTFEFTACDTGTGYISYLGYNP